MIILNVSSVDFDCLIFEKSQIEPNSELTLFEISSDLKKEENYG